MQDVSATSPVLDDIARMWRFARAHDIAAELKRLHRPVLLRSLAAVVFDWALIFAAFAAVTHWGLIAVPAAIVVIGNRQRALGNLLHDAAHGSFGRHRRRADGIARWLLFRPMWVSLEIYRREHFAHHRLLGVPGHDVDLIHCEADMDRPWRALLWHHAGQFQTYRGALCGHLLRATARERLLMLAAWGCVAAVPGVAIGPAAALEFAALWLASRASMFHLITTFREISDHVGLRPGSLIGFTRNQTASGLLAAVFHPHNNGYHLAHHLNPGMPYHALPRAHALLLGWPDYAAATHCARYFGGETPLVRSWVRRPRTAARASPAAGRSPTASAATP